ncbi:MAG: DUF5011 domain-containing protein [Clostridiales bacterium]|jgi:hypothetical protein|nr:DUF5011 domain-containing protein [Clostridiales bacterium]
MKLEDRTRRQNRGARKHGFTQFLTFALLSVLLWSALASVSVSASGARSAPTLTVSGSNPLVLYTGESGYTEQGASAYDINDGDLTAQVRLSGSVDADASGTYIVTYEVTNSMGLKAAATRYVLVLSPEERIARMPYGFSGQGEKGGVNTHAGLVAEAAGAMDLTVSNISSSTALIVKLLDGKGHTQYQETFRENSQRQVQIPAGKYGLSVTIDNAEGHVIYQLNLLMPEIDLTMANAPSAPAPDTTAAGAAGAAGGAGGAGGSANVSASTTTTAAATTTAATTTDAAVTTTTTVAMTTTAVTTTTAAPETTTMAATETTTMAATTTAIATTTAAAEITADSTTVAESAATDPVPTSAIGTAAATVGGGASASPDTTAAQPTPDPAGGRNRTGDGGVVPEEVMLTALCFIMAGFLLTLARANKPEPVPARAALPSSATIPRALPSSASVSAAHTPADTPAKGLGDQDS